MQPFNLLSVPLTGIHLIEAGAGTGKTYTIANLVVRLVIEKNLAINRLLVVTFTEAATEELRGRIRARLRETYDAFITEQSADPILKELLQRYAENADRIKNRLNNALRGFDEAPIFTIHGFCLRVLQDNAFESGVLFDTELIQNQEPLLREIVEDFWRRHFYEADVGLVKYALDNGFHPDMLLQFLKQHLGKQYEDIQPKPTAASAEDFAQVEQTFTTAFETAKAAWPAAQEAIAEMFLNAKGFNQSTYKDQRRPEWFKAMNRMMRGSIEDFTANEALKKFSQSTLEKSKKKGLEPPKHNFFELCETLKNAYDSIIALYENQLLFLKCQLLNNSRASLKRVKEQQNVQSFDDLLWNVHAALQGDAGDQLAARLHKRYPAALIDEFQDTDALQYEIFQRIYPPDTNNLLFLIGDPKQSIYSFRGADVFTYLTAANDAGDDHRYTLGQNWRSTPELIQAVNTLFDSKRVKHPFLLPHIGFQPATPSDKAKTPAWATDSKPLQLWYFSRAQVDPRYLGESETNQQISKPHASERVTTAVASEIVRLLNLPDGPAPGDIAVLVRKNQQALEIGQALRQRNVPSVVYSRDSLFNSRETSEVQRVLQAVAEPGNERHIRSAVTTDMFGETGNSLQALLNDDIGWEDRLLSFRRYHTLWQRDGFMPMFQTLLVEEKVAQRLLRFADGERRLTNVLHLAEVLQAASLRLRRPMNALLKWLGEQQLGADDGNDEYQIRLESDENAVKLVTIHKSKGLQYDIVFVPFAWDVSQKGSGRHEGTAFHDDTDGNKLRLDLTPDKANKDKAQYESRSEDLRLLYVAVTRAVYRCYLAWGPIRSGDKSALAYLLHPELKKLGETPDDTLLTELNALAGDAIGVTNLPDKSQEKYRGETRQFSAPPRLRVMQREVKANWQVSSFTGMTQSSYGKHWLAEQPDRDGWITAPAFNPEADDPVFTLPPGLETGNLLHDILAAYDFQTPPTESLVVTNRLQQHPHFDAVCQLLDNLRQTSLVEDNPALRLDNVPRQARLNEMEFYYPVSQLQADTLMKQLKNSGLYPPETDNRKFGFEPFQGYIRGFIDLIFEFGGKYYLADYKTSLLGDRLDDYRHDQLNHAMQQHHYPLQYTLYTVALHRYLAARLPDYDYDRHIGGVFYLFLRGMRPEHGPTYGVFQDRLTKDAVHRLSAMFEDSALDKS